MARKIKIPYAGVTEEFIQRIIKINPTVDPAFIRYAYQAEDSVVLATNYCIIRVASDGSMHGFVLSHDAYRHTEDFKHILKALMDRLGFRKLTCNIPKEKRSLGRLLKMIGFTYVGSWSSESVYIYFGGKS